MQWRLGLLMMLLSFGACIGTDVLDWPVLEERVVIATRLQALALGESRQLRAEYYDTLGMLMNREVTWSSSQPELLSVTPQGRATAHMEGLVVVTAQVGTAMDTLHVRAGGATEEMNPERRASFQGLGNYTVSGTGILEQMPDSTLELRFTASFSASNGPGLHVYLSNSNGGVAGGVDLGELKRNSGAQTYAVPASVTLNSYNYIIIHCQPFNVPFGYGEFQE